MGNSNRQKNKKKKINRRMKGREETAGTNKNNGNKRKYNKDTGDIR
jgi:hypothetical protein